MATVTICIDFGTQENKVCYCCHCFPIYLPWSDGTGCHDLYFLNVVFFFSSMVTAQSFIRQTKDSIPSRRDGTLTPKERPQSILASSFYKFVSSQPWACPMQIGLAMKRVYLFHLKFSLWSADILSFSFLQAFPFLCLLATAILDSFFLFEIPNRTIW